MSVSPANLTDDQLNAYIKARLVISGIDLSLFPATPDPVTGAPTQDQVLSSLRGFVRTNPAVINTWRPADPKATAQNAAMLSQMLYPPLEYPSITEAWTGKAVGA